MTDCTEQDVRAQEPAETRKRIAMLLADGRPRTLVDIQIALKMSDINEIHLNDALSIMSRWGLIQSEAVKKMKVWTRAVDL